MQRAFLLPAFLIAGWLPALLKPETLSQVTALYTLADTPNPYFVPEHALLLYIWSPVVAVSACLFFLSPGLILALAFNRGRSTGEWTLTGMVLSLPVISIPTAIIQAMMDQPLHGRAFAMVVIAASVVCFAILWIRIRRNPQIEWPLGTPYEKRTAWLMLLITLLLAAVFTPKLYWENFTRDGLQVLESTRLLYYQPLPFWPDEIVVNYPTFNAMLSMFVPSWFVRMFGEIEASVRLPYLLYLSALYGSLLSLIHYQHEAQLKLPQQLFLWLALISCTIVIIYNASYNPYAADIAHPAAREIFLTSLFLGYVLYFLKGQTGWMVYFTALTFITLPLGTVLIGLWWLATVALWKERPWRMLVFTSLAVAGCMTLSALAPQILRLFDHPLPGHVFSAGNLMQRMQLTGGNTQKLAFLILPCGILPALSMLAWPRNDRISRTFTLVVIMYFVFFFVQKQTGLNHYIPVMLLPLVPFWRNSWWIAKKAQMYFLTTTFAVFALVISLPQNAKPDISSRIIGSSIEDRIGGYEKLDFKALQRQEILGHLFPPVFQRSVPEKQYGGVPWVWYHYAHRKDHAGRNINYIIQRKSDPPPPGADLFREIGDVSLYVRSKLVWKEHRRLKPHSPPGNRIYAIPKESLYQK